MTASSLKCFSIDQQTKLYRFGSPLETGARSPGFVIPEHSEAVSEIPFFKIIPGEDLIFEAELRSEQHIYGLGQMLGSLDKKGRIYRMFAKDQSGYTPDKVALYGSHPFFIIKEGSRCTGFFLDFPGEIIFDFGYSNHRETGVKVLGKDLDLYLFEGDSIPEICRSFLKITGQPCLPPAWAFGFQQCRWSYMTAGEVRDVAARYRKLDIPCDAIYLDIDYMDNYKVFTYSKENFGDLPKLASDLNQQGFKLVPIIDPGVKVEPGYKVYDQGIEEELFCLDKKDNLPFIGTVWPGYAVFPDFLNGKTRKWWGRLYKFFTEMGINAIWNDMNEPAIFATREGLAGLKRIISRLEDNKDPGSTLVNLMRDIRAHWHQEDYYEDFYHRLDNGEQINHRKVHNLYGKAMAEACADGLEELEPDTRHLVISRSSYVGMHRKAVLWTGDNSSNWEDLAYHIRMLISCNLTGFFYVGADVGGFCGDVSPELLIRWHQAGVVSPLFRNHSEKDTRRQEPWAFDKETQKHIRDAVKLRYALITYLYSEFMRSVIDLDPFIKPLIAEYETKEALSLDSQLLVGKSLMAAPVIQPNARGRNVHLPGARWLYWPASDFKKFNCTVYEPGNHYVDAALGELPLFLKENSLLPLKEPENFWGERQLEELTMLGFVNEVESANFEILLDDGQSFAFKKGVISRLKITLDMKKDPKAEVVLDDRSLKFQSLKILRFVIFNQRGERSEFTKTLK